MLWILCRNLQPIEYVLFARYPRVELQQYLTVWLVTNNENFTSRLIPIDMLFILHTFASNVQIAKPRGFLPL